MAVRKKKQSSNVKGIKRILRFMINLLVDVIILFIFVKVFTYAFNFSYDVFADSAKDPSSQEYVVVEIQPDSSASDIADALYDSGVIENKYVMLAKMKIGGYSSQIQANKYGLSPSMTYDEILDILCGISEEEDE